MSEKRVLRVAITGGAGRIAYSLIPLLLDGRVFGNETLIDLRLVDIPQADMRLQGVLMEIEDCNFSCMEKITTTTDTATGFQNVEVAILLGGTPRKQGMERIVVYEGDTAEGLAKEFCEKNGLTEDMEEKLRMLLEQQIAGVLPKIVEDDVNESEEDSSIQYGNRRGTDAKFPEQKVA